MNYEQIEDFKDDVSEGDIVTLLLSDKTQETGTVKKIRSSNLKIEILSSNNTVVIQYEDIQRYALGQYEFIERKKNNFESKNNNQQNIVNNNSYINQLSTVTNNLNEYKKKLNIDKNKVEIICDKISTEITYASLEQEIYPNFNFEIKASSYTSQKRIKEFRTTVKNKYESAVKLKELSRLHSTILDLKKITAIYFDENGLHALLGAICWIYGDVKNAQNALKTAAQKSNSPSDWYNYAVASKNDYFNSYHALKEYLKVVNIETLKYEDILMTCKLGKLSNSLNSAIPIIIEISKKISDFNLFKKIIYCIIFILHEEKYYNESISIYDIIENNSEKDLVIQHVEKEINKIAFITNETYVNWENENWPNISKQLEPMVKVIKQGNIINSTAPKFSSTTVYSTDHGYNNNYKQHYEIDNLRITGYIQDYGNKKVGWNNPTWHGHILGDDNNVYFFFGEQLDDGINGSLAELLKKQDFSKKVIFTPFVNSSNNLQAKRIKLSDSRTNIHRPTSFDISSNQLRQNAQLLISLGKRNEAVSLLREALNRYKNDIDINLLLAQQLSALGKSKEAADTYEHLLHIEKRPGARKNAHIQYALLLGKAGEQKKALEEIEKLIISNPNDVFLKNLPDKIRQYALDSENEEGDDEQLDIWEDTDTIGVPQLLKKELEHAEFYDEVIVSRGGRPVSEDAERLKQKALSMTKDSQGYFRFLEAAKAYSLLPVGTFLYDDYKNCLCRYATQKGEVLVNRMSGLASSPELAQKNADTISKLNDSATCYFIEGMSLLSNEYVKDVGPYVVRNYLRSVLFKYFSQNPRSYNSKLLSMNMTEMLKYMLNSEDEGLFNITCDALLTWGSYPEVWNALAVVKGGPGYFTRMLNNNRFLEKVKKSFENITGHKEETQLTVAEFLKVYFRFRQKERELLGESFRKLQHIRKTGSFEYFRLLNTELENFPRTNKALQASDRRMLDRLAIVLDSMMVYRTAKDEERTDILVRARQGVKDTGGQKELFPGFRTLKIEIAEMPTYWQLVGCEEIISNCLETVDIIEQYRTKKRLPLLNFILDPPAFKEIGNEISTSLRIDNSGTAANKIDISINVINEYGKEIHKITDYIERISAKDSGTIRITIPQYVFLNPQESTQLVINATYTEGRADECRYTVDRDKGNHFTIDQIPWSYTSSATPRTFKGRKDIITHLISSLNNTYGRSHSYILYGVTRSGKTSILDALQKKLHGNIMADNLYCICINWNFGESANCSSPNALWKQLLNTRIYSALNDWNVPVSLISKVEEILPEQPHGEHFNPLMEGLKKLGIYPVILIDEFTYFRNLHDRELLGPEFLSVMRELALNGYATFIVAGTYDLLAMTRDSHYGITGQFVNSERIHVTSLDEASARELVNIFSDYLTFTKDACNYILRITDCRPYLIQLFCYYCAFFACHTQRSILGIPEIQNVEHRLCFKSSLIHEEKSVIDGEKIDIPVMASDRFDKNHLFENEERWPAYAAIISILTFRGNQDNGFLTYNQIKSIWKDNKLDISLLPDILKELVERHVITEDKDEGDDGYRLRVELFRRWWQGQNHTLEKDLDAAYKIVPINIG